MYKLSLKGLERIGLHNFIQQEVIPIRLDYRCVEKCLKSGSLVLGGEVGRS